MTIINKPRMSGKTTELIKLAYNGRDKRILCHSQEDCRRVFNLAQELEMPIPFPITYDDLIKKNLTKND